MAAECGNVKEILKKYCKDGLIRNEFLQGCEKFLTEVTVPAKWKGKTDYKLQQVHETYQYREKMLSGNLLAKKYQKSLNYREKP